MIGVERRVGLSPLTRAQENNMGFSLEQMIADLEQIIALETNPTGILSELAERLAWWKNYAKECGQLRA